MANRLNSKKNKPDTQVAEKPEEKRPEGRPNLSVPYDLADAILKYLGTRPYQEVHLMVGRLMRCAPKIKE